MLHLEQIDAGEHDEIEAWAGNGDASENGEISGAVQAEVAEQLKAISDGMRSSISVEDVKVVSTPLQHCSLSTQLQNAHTQAVDCPAATEALLVMPGSDCARGCPVSMQAVVRETAEAEVAKVVDGLHEEKDDQIEELKEKLVSARRKLQVAKEQEDLAEQGERTWMGP